MYFIIYFIVSILFQIFTPFVNDIYTIFNIIIFQISFLIVMIAIINITNDGINLLNIFAVSYFVFLGLNSCNISDLQLEKNSYDLYFYFIGPMIFMMTLYYFEYYSNININIKKLV